MCLPCFLGEESCVFLSRFHCLPGMHCVTCHNECTEKCLPVNGIYLTASRVHSKAAELLEGLGGGGGAPVHRCRGTVCAKRTVSSPLEV